jgi:hypothetical protein
MIDFESFIFHKSRIPQDFKEQEKFFQELEQSFCEEIKNSDKAKAYFEKFRASDIDYFVTSYVRKKIDLIKLYEYYDQKYREKENYELRFHKKAEIALHAILQKKLFNLQLQWRANQIQINGIDICYDFQFWEKHIASCPFVPPIEEHEKELMKEYLLNANELDEEITEHMYPSWQDYDELTHKDARGLPEDMNSWYEFYDGRMGTGALLNLPDVRTEVESFYMQLNHEGQSTSPAPQAEVDTRPYLMGYGNDIINFAKIFESDKHFVQLYKGYEVEYNSQSRFPDPERINYAIYVLSEADRPVSIPSYLNWDEAILFAAKKYSNTKIAEALDIVYDEYIIFRELGMATNESPEALAKAYKEDHIVQLYRTAILKGRVKNGEPEDFNY